MKPLAILIMAKLMTVSPESRPCTHGTCREYSIELVGSIERASAVTGVSASLITAVGWAESNLNPNRHGKYGRGMWGLHPRGLAYHYALPLCNLDRGKCVEVQATFAAQYLAWEKRRLGSMYKALRSYVGGKTSKGVKKSHAYARAVLRIQKAIERGTWE